FTEGDLTVDVPLSSIGKSNSQLGYSSANYYDVPVEQDTSLLKYTFHPGETTGKVTVLVARDDLPEPDDVFSIKLRVKSNTTEVAATVSDPIGIGTILNDDGVLSSADITFAGGFDKQTRSLLRADIEAAILRTKIATSGRVPNLEINVVADTPS